MKKISASQVGMLLLVTMVMVRAFFVSDLNVFRGEGFTRLFTHTIPEMMGLTDAELADAGSTATVMGSVTESSNESIQSAPAYREPSSVADDEVLFVMNEEDLAGLADENEIPIELRLFTPSSGNELIAMTEDIEEENDHDPDLDVAPLDGQNTITSQLNLLFPRGSQQ